MTVTYLVYWCCQMVLRRDLTGWKTTPFTSGRQGQLANQGEPENMAITRAHQEMRYLNVTWHVSSYLFTLPTSMALWFHTHTGTSAGSNTKTGNPRYTQLFQRNVLFLYALRKRPWVVSPETSFWYNKTVILSTSPSPDSQPKGQIPSPQGSGHTKNIQGSALVRRVPECPNVRD